MIAVSEYIAEQLVALGAPRSKIVIRYLGIPLRQPVSRTSRRYEILFVGRLVDKKGVADLLKAVAMLPEKHLGVRVRIVGFGPLLEGLKLDASKLGVNAEFVGALTSEEVAYAMSEAMIFVAPSKTAPNGDAEGFGLVFLEAAAQGLPIVAYAHGGVVEAVEHNGNALLAPEGDVETLALNIEKLLENEELRDKFSSRGRDRVLNEFDIRRRTSMLEDIYDAASAPKS
ncbi:UNVERIFIED_ORG: glycosyltransferase involved in cell wall biosynthesis [Arthrobacter sp. UYEF10]